MDLPLNKILIGDVVEKLKQLPDECIHTCITSPPYWNLRDYGITGQLGLEALPSEYVQKLVIAFREVRRVLRKDGTLWLNLGDSYAANWNSQRLEGGGGFKDSERKRTKHPPPGLKSKDLVGIPWRVAFALQEDGYYLRSDIIWQKTNPMPESVNDRPTKAHEYIFLLTKSDRYFYDAEAIKETATYSQEAKWDNGADGHGGGLSHAGQGSSTRKFNPVNPGMRNKRTVWTVQTEPFPEAHFATYPEMLIAPCVLAGTSERGACPHCGASWKRLMEHPDFSEQPKRESPKMQRSDRTSAGQAWQDWRDEHPSKTVGWDPQCPCGSDLKPDDLQIIETPTGERVAEDPSLETGRKGFNRPRGENEGKRPITRWEQRNIAKQIKTSPNKAEMEAEAGEAFAHYIRTDRTGARPVPSDLLDAWVTKGWLKREDPPKPNPSEPVPCVVLDPFMGAGTTALVALKSRRNFIGIELNPEYAAIAERRISQELAQKKLF